MISIEKKNINGKEPNIEKLREHISENGNVIKNYRVLCEILNISPKTNTDRKKKQMEKLNSYFSYSIDGYKIIIDEIYDNPKRVISHERSAYGAYIEAILVNKIMNSNKKDKGGNQILYVNMKELCELLGVFNKEFNKYKYNHDALKKRLKYLYEFYEVSSKHDNSQMDMDTMIGYFYGKVYLQLTQMIKRNLTRLEEKQIIHVEPVYEYHPEDELYHVKWYVESTGEMKDKYSVIESCRLEAMAEMKEEINNLRRKKGKPTYSNFNMSHIYIYGREDEYFKKLSDMCKEKLTKSFGYSPKYIVPAYKISLHPTIIQKIKENEDYISVRSSCEEIGWNIDLNNAVLKSTYRGFQKSFNEIEGFTDTGFIYVDKKTGEVCECKDTKTDRNKCYSVLDLKRFKILQRVVMLFYDAVQERSQYDRMYVDFIERILNDDFEPLTNPFQSDEFLGND